MSKNNIRSKHKKSDAIVKIISNNVDIDIFSPYKISSDGESIGTGFFIDKGYILTCAHVVSGSVKLWITSPMEGKTKIPVTIYSICYEKDLAILKTIDYVNTDRCSLGNSNDIKSGDLVTAVGYPMGHDRLKTTSGSVSGIQNRFIQTDAPINPGNSGGPLFDDNDNVIGINTSKLNQLFAENIGFATPIDDFYVIKDKMLHSNQRMQIFKEPLLYCEIQHTSDNLYKLFGLDATNGCIITNLIKNSPLYNAGIRTNDILLKFDKYQIDSNGDIDVEWSNDKIEFVDLCAKLIDNVKYDVKYLSIKNQKTMTTTVTLNDYDIFKIKHVRVPYDDINYEIFAGLIISELTLNHVMDVYDADYSTTATREIRSYSKISNRTNGVIFISGILQGSYASTVDNVENGSIICKINGSKVHNMNDVRNAILNKMLVIDTNKMMYLQLSNNQHVIINLNDAFAEETELSSRYKYNMSNLYNVIFNA
jgi:S1-C subfamily serine protease